MNLENKIEAILLFKNEPISFRELSKILDKNVKEVEEAIKILQDFYKERGIVLVSDGETISLGTHPNASKLIETILKEEFSRDLGRAGLETLAIVLYKGPITRREIDYIRGVNSSYILRTLLIRGLIERLDYSAEHAAGRGYSYKSTLDLYKHLGITKKEDLPEYEVAMTRINDFMNTSTEEEKQNENVE